MCMFACGWWSGCVCVRCAGRVRACACVFACAMMVVSVVCGVCVFHACVRARVRLGTRGLCVCVCVWGTSGLCACVCGRWAGCVCVRGTGCVRACARVFACAVVVVGVVYGVRVCVSCVRGCVRACGDKRVVRVSVWAVGGVRVCAWCGLRAGMCACVCVCGGGGGVWCVLCVRACLVCVLAWVRACA